MNHKGLSRTQVNELISSYILSNIPTVKEIKQGWDVDITDTPKDKLNWVFSCYDVEFNYKNNKLRYPNNQNRFAEWLMGLPSSINIDFENYKIIQLGKEWGYLPENATERQEDKFIANWFNAMAYNIIKLHEKLNK